MRPPLLVLLAILLALGVAACDGDGNDAESETEGSGNAATRTPRVTATASPEPTAAPARLEEPLYIALGDSLSAGIGATVPSQTGFVGLVHEGLGEGVSHLNLGVPGDTSHDLLNGGKLDEAIGHIQRRLSDDIEGNEVALVTLEIGGNDLLDIYFDLVIPGTCPSVPEALQRPQCVQALRDALDNYLPNLQETLTRLQEADPDLPVFLMTLYNPFSGGSSIFDQLGQLSLEGQPDTPFPEGLNDIIRAQAAAFGVQLVDVHPLFLGKSGQYIASDFIHPNDTGYGVMADAVLEAVAAAGVSLP